MKKHNFNHLLPSIDIVVEWYLEEIIYCLKRYVNMDDDDAYDATISSFMIELLREESDYGWMTRESAFYWAMTIYWKMTHLNDLDSYWWHDKQRMDQKSEYEKTRHQPPFEKR